MPSLQTYYSTRLSQEHYTINHSSLFFTVLLPYGCVLKKNVIHKLLNQSKTCVGATKGCLLLTKYSAGK